jgi:hypothetical protein
MSSAAEQAARATDARDVLKARYACEPWFRGVGVALLGEGFGLRLNVASDLDVARVALPRDVDGLPVEVVRVNGFVAR